MIFLIKKLTIVFFDCEFAHLLNTLCMSNLISSAQLYLIRSGFKIHRKKLICFTVIIAD